MSADSDKVILIGVGDVGPIHEPMEAYSQMVKPIIATGDIRFAQCERTYSTRGHMASHFGSNKHGLDTRQPPHMASVFKEAGFNLISIASNHGMDWGGEAIKDTMDLFHDMGMQTIGAGMNSEEARKPAIFDIRGTRVGVLGYCSVLRDGYAAGPENPGIAPMRAHTYYEQQEYQAGTPPRVVTVPYENDLEALCEDIAKTKELADVVIVSLHWGVHFIPRVIADYQRTVMKAVFDQGASMILGHHAHIPKGIEVYDGKVCFYSLSNFMYSSKGGSDAPKYEIKFDPSYPRYPSQPYGIDGKKSLIVRAELSKNGADRVSFYPVQIDMNLYPEPLAGSDPRFPEIVEFLDWCSEGMDHKFTVEGDQVVVS